MRTEPTLPPAEATPATDSMKIVSGLRKDADDFVRLWRYYWEISDSYMYLSERPVSNNSTGAIAGHFAWPAPAGVRPVVLSTEDSVWAARESRGPIAQGGVSRNTLLHCHPVAAARARYDRVAAYIIEGQSGLRAICPGWYPLGAWPPWDERTGLDISIVAPLRARLRDARQQLIAGLRQGAIRLPNDHWIAGQRVRFALDQADTTEAHAAVAACNEPAWWCVALRAYLNHTDDDGYAADSLFALAVSIMPSATRCEWTDLALLLRDEDRADYSQIPCEHRDTVNANLWWLADPQYNDRINERRSEHFARRVLYEMRVATSFHERWDMRMQAGGVAIKEMIVRYGWPSFSFWDGRHTDTSHYSYLKVKSAEDQSHGRFTTAEYTYPRYRLVSSLSAIRNPTAAREDDWGINASAHWGIFPTDTIFWPQEHFDRVAGPMVQLWNQHGLFRRQDDVLLAVASRLLNEEFPGAAADTMWGWLYTGDGPSRMAREQKGAIIGVTNVFKTLVPSRPQLVSLELHGQRPAGVMARARFGIAPPKPLSSLQPGELDLSQPVFIRPTTPDQLPPSDAEQALARMYGTSVFRAPDAVGIYWETYGVADSDSISISITIQRRETPPGLLRRIGIALRLADRAGGALTVRWSEQQAQEYMRVRSGRVPIQGRIMTLATSQLRPGGYTIVMSAARRDDVPRTANRDFWIVE